MTDSKIVQIAVSGAKNSPDILYVLYDDGQLWSLNHDENHQWERITPPLRKRERER
jgi:hypothetical protein